MPRLAAGMTEVRSPIAARTASGACVLSKARAARNARVAGAARAASRSLDASAARVASRSRAASGARGALPRCASVEGHCPGWGPQWGAGRACAVKARDRWLAV